MWCGSWRGFINKLDSFSRFTLADFVFSLSLLILSDIGRQQHLFSGSWDLKTKTRKNQWAQNKLCACWWNYTRLAVLTVSWYHIKHRFRYIILCLNIFVISLRFSKTILNIFSLVTNTLEWIAIIISNFD